MNNEFNEEVCPICNEEECSCTKEPRVSAKRKVFLNTNEKNIANNDCCDCDENCESCDCECHDILDNDKKKSLAILGATVVAVGVAGGILYFVKNKK